MECWSQGALVTKLHNANEAASQGWSGKLSAALEYTLPCSGCKHCRTNVTPTLLEQSPQRSTLGWLLGGFARRQPQSIAIDYSKVENEKCSERHRAEIDTSELLVRNQLGNVSEWCLELKRVFLLQDLPSALLSTAVNESPSRLETITEGWRRYAECTPRTSDNSDYYAMRQSCK